MTSNGMTAPPVMVSMIFCGLVQLGWWRRGSPETHGSWRPTMMAPPVIEALRFDEQRWMMMEKEMA
ncbi:hypothetical protein F2Q70_00042259 [Brassica cretica]|uniref:Uncharacterized protein n=1 Tax=Brassica cretica TaxID=69181 RepID=A0A8S9KJK6_BRACR|nr:hypothetical protein F2Q70_00042259 [Brassica cretica]